MRPLRAGDTLRLRTKTVILGGKMLRGGDAGAGVRFAAWGPGTDREGPPEASAHGSWDPNTLSWEGTLDTARWRPGTWHVMAMARGLQLTGTGTAEVEVTAPEGCALA